MKLTNNEIYIKAQELVTVFNDKEQKFPIKLNFYLQKNKNTLVSLAQDIEQARISIIQTYGTPNENGETYTIPEDKIAEASNELKDLFELEQEVNIYTVNIDVLNEDLILTTAQMEALMFMID